MRRFLALAAMLCALLLAACGGSSHLVRPRSTTPGVAPAHLAPKQAANIIANPASNRPVQTHDVVVPLNTACPPGKATMGCSVQPVKTAPVITTTSDPPAGPRFPDVSDWQGHPNWDAALHSGIYGAVAKIGEAGSLDPDVGYNVASFRRLRMRWSVYLFVRPIGCVAEGQALVNMLHDIGGPSSTGPVAIADEEVPGLAGYATCIDGVVYAVYHRHITIYTSPGTWGGGAGGGLDAWLASYGPLSAPGCPWGCHVSAFQFTDGHYGYPIDIPGIGLGDVSVSYSLFSTPKPPKPRTVCWGKGSTPGSSACKTIEAQANHDWQQYQAFHKGLVSHQSQASKVRGVIFSLQKNKASVYQTYKGPGLGWYAAREKPEVYYGNLNKARHDALVKAHHA